MNHCRKVILLWIVMVVGVAGPASAKAPEIEWTRTIGGKKRENGKCIQKTYDGNYVIVGEENGIKHEIGKYGEGSYCYVYLVKIDEKGKVLWERTYGDTDFFYSGEFIQQTADSGFIISGERGGTRNENSILLLKTDNQGKTEWMRVYGKGSICTGSEVYQTADSCYLVIGSIGSWNKSEVFIVKVNSAGDSLYAKRYGYNDAVDWCESGCLTEDGGCIITGMTSSFGYNKPYLLGRLYLMRINSDGDSIWTVTFGGKEGHGAGYCMRETFDRGYIVTGENRGNFIEKAADIFLCKVDSMGNIIWDRVYGGKYYDTGYDVRQTSDGGYIITGLTHKTTGRDSMWHYIVRTDDNGIILWTKNMKSSSSYRASPYSVIQTEDGGFFLVGRKSGDILLIKLKPEK